MSATGQTSPVQSASERLNDKTINDYAQFLRSPTAINNLSSAQQTELLLQGVVVELTRDGSQPAVAALTDCAHDCAILAARVLALESLERLAKDDNPDAISALFRLAIEQGYPPAANILRSQGMLSGDPDRDAVFFLLAQDFDRFRTLDPRLEASARVYLQNATGDLRGRIRAAAEALGLTQWITIVTAIETAGADALAELARRYPSFPPIERDLAITLLDQVAQDGSTSAAEAICQLFILYQNETALRLAKERGYSPREPIQRALFLFLSEQWQAFERFDFDQRYLIAAYETADPTLRKRILDLSRSSGQMEWYQGISGANRMRWLNDLTDADWGHAIGYLAQARRWVDLWRLAQASSPAWSARILTELHNAGWQPEVDYDQNGFVRLVDLAAEAIRNPLTIRPRYSFSAPTLLDDLTALAISPDGQHLALGTSSNAIHLWQIADTPTPLPTLHGAAAQVRALAFGPEDEFLIAATGDHIVRVYRWRDGKEVKALKGHEGLVRSLVISPDGRGLYTASFDGSLRSWRFPSGSESKTFYRASGELFDVALSPEGDYLVTAGADRVIQVFQLPEGQLVRELSGHDATITNLVTGPTTPLAASYSRDRTIRVWNYVSGKPMQAFGEQREVITGLCIHPNEHVLISAGYSGKIHLESISTGKTLAELAAHRRPVIGLALNPEGTRLVSASTDAAVTIWNLEYFLLIRQPVENLPADQGERIRRELEEARLLSNEKKWLTFTLELVRWKQRFDVQVETPGSIEAGEFDIQL